MRQLLLIFIVLLFMSAIGFSQLNIVMDAQKDAYYNTLTGPDDGWVYIPVEAASPDMPMPPDDEYDLSANCWLAWDADYLYLYAEVLDEFVQVNNSTTYENDAIEFKMDPDPTMQTTSGVAGIRLSALGEDDAEVPDGVDNLVKGAELDEAWEPVEGEDYARVETDLGYNLEFRLPFDKIVRAEKYVDNSVNGIMGLAINVMDNDNVGRDTVLRWSASIEDAVWSNPQLLGTITFLTDNKIKLEPINSAGGDAVNDNPEMYIPEGGGGGGDYLDPVFPPVLQPGPFPFGTETVRGDAPVDVTDPNEVIHEYTAYKGTVVVDGDVSDPTWTAIPWTLMEFNRDIVGGGSGSLWDPAYAAVSWDGWEDMATWFKIVHDDNNIYLALLRYDDDNSFVEGTDQNSGNIWQNDAYQIVIDTNLPGESDGVMPGAELGVCLVDGLEVYNFWSTAFQNPATQLELADGDCSSGLPSTDGKAIRGNQEDTADGFKEVLEVAFVKYDEMEDDMLGMLSVCALDRDYDAHESVNQWAQGIFDKTRDEYGSVLWSSQSVPTAVESKIDARPTSFALGQNYPNPFNPTTTISYSLKSLDHVLLKVYTVTGREIATLVDETQSAGEHAITFDASQLSSGVYLYQLQTAAQTFTRKMTLLR